jgi:hypothetical protein
MNRNDIIKVNGRMFQVKIKIPESHINMDKFENGVSLLKQYYHVDTILRAKGLLWFCNEIETIDYVEIK